MVAAAAVCTETAAMNAAVSQDILNLAFSLFLHLSFAITGLLISEHSTGNNESGSLEGGDGIYSICIMPRRSFDELAIMSHPVLV